VGPRFQLITRAWSQMEWLSAAEGIAKCALLQISERKFEESIGSWTEHAWSALRLQQEAEPVKAAQEPAGTAFHAEFGSQWKNRLRWSRSAGRSQTTTTVELGRSSVTRHAAGQLFGSWRAAGWSDLLWRMPPRLRLRGHHQPEGASPRALLADGLGLRTVPHIPSTCPAAARRDCRNVRRGRSPERV